ncbi:hypothetical protein ACFIOY_36885 [Bradyrhizobium sp. TZ2]
MADAQADAVAGKVRAGLDVASDMAKDTMERARSTANNAATAGKMIRGKAALIGGLGVAIGAIRAASIPTTRAEAGAMGKASDRVKRAASTATQSGFEAAKDIALGGRRRGKERRRRRPRQARQPDHRGRDGQRLKEVADDVVTAAFDPSRTSHN